MTSHAYENNLYLFCLCIKSFFQGTLFDVLVDTHRKTLNSLLASTLFLPLFRYRGKCYMIRGIFPNPIGILDQREGMDDGEEVNI